ncbi:protein FimX [Pseudomonas aeruginosa PA38182]|nr:protein FimX [Pseudomonas aeruginosa PA38182]
MLLDSSVDAITYVHDGMHIYANRSYMALFGYEDAEELEGLPVIDLIASCDQGAFKDFLKGYQNDQRQTELVCTGVKLDGQEFKARISLSAATYDGEPCIQVVIRGEVDNAELEEKLREVSSQDPVTGLYNRSHFLDLMDAAVQQAVTARKPSTLAYIHLNGYPSLQADHGLSGIDLLLGQLAGLMREQFGEEADLARFGDSIFAALFKGKTPEQAQAALQRLLKKVENHLFELNGRSAQATLSIGVAGLDEKTAKAQDVMNRAHRCADDAARKGGSQIKQYNPAEELAAAAQRGDVIAILQQALETNSFRLLFQPVISLRGDSHENYEVLLRLLNPQGQEVPPAEFLHAAKEAGWRRRSTAG